MSIFVFLKSQASAISAQFTGANTAPSSMISSDLTLIVKLAKLDCSQLSQLSQLESLSDPDARKEIRKRNLPRSCKPSDSAPSSPFRLMPNGKLGSSCQQKTNTLRPTGSKEFLKNEPTICKFCSKPFSGADFAAEHEEFGCNRNTDAANDSMSRNLEKDKYMSRLGLKSSAPSECSESSLALKTQRRISLPFSEKNKLRVALCKNPIPYATKFGKKLLSTSKDQFGNWILQYKELFAALTRRRFRYKLGGFKRIHEEDFVHRTASSGEATIRNAERILGLNRPTWLKLAKCRQPLLLMKKLKFEKRVTSSALQEKKPVNQVRPQLEQKNQKGKSTVIPPNVLSNSQTPNRQVSVKVEDFTKSSIFKKFAGLKKLNASVI